MTNAPTLPHRRRTLLVAATALTGAVLSGCSGGSPSSDAATPAAAVRQASPTGFNVTANARALAVEEIQQAVGERVTADEDHYGSGTGSPCSTSSARVFTADCGQAAAETGAVAALALTRIDGRTGFATLNRTAHALVAAAATYRQLGCAGQPSADAVRHACLSPAAVIAQGLPDLRAAILLAYGGK